MSKVVRMQQRFSDERYEELVKELEYFENEERWASIALHKVRDRFIAADLVVQTGKRKGEPLTERGRADLWRRIEDLIQERDRLLKRLRQLYRLLDS